MAASVDWSIPGGRVRQFLLDRVQGKGRAKKYQNAIRLKKAR